MVKRRNLPISFILVSLALVLLEGCEQVKARTDWPYPRFDLANTGANPTVKCQLLEKPTELWEVTFPEGDVPWSLFPVVADIDSDGRSEYVIGGWNRSPEYWLYAFNIEDGSILWKRYFDNRLYWSAPIIVDVNGDGKEDIVLATDTQVMALNGSDASSIWEQPFPGGGMGMTVADVNNDGWVEVVINDYGEPKRIYLLNGQDGSTIWRRETGGSAYNIPTVGDVNGDGYLEILSHQHLYNPSREQLKVWDQEGNELWSYQASPSAEQEANAPPELGWVPDFGYISTTIADFNADGEMEIGWGTRCHYYLLNGHGDLLWRVPTIEGYGVSFTRRDDGTIEADTHGTGGPSGYAAGVGNLDTDPALEVVLSFEPEYRTDWDGETWVRTRFTPANEIRVFDGEYGTLQWVFQGEYLSEDRSEKMNEPILVDLNADGLLDILALSTNTYLYAIRGTTGEQLMAYRVGTEDAPTSVVHHLTFAVDAEDGIVLYVTEVYTSPNGTDWTSALSLHALQISSDCR
jgi:outer membrane protein assembly factor BamB